MAYDSNPAATHDPTTGVVVPVSWLDLINTNFAAIGAAWTSFTPTWEGSTGNPVVNNGTLTGAYLSLGKLLFFRIALSVGSTTTFGSGFWTFRLPNSLTFAATGAQVGQAKAFDTSASTNYTGYWQGTDSAGSITLGKMIFGFPAASSPTSPFTWATGDSLNISGTCEVA